jgi:predicted ATPase/class 3 adenylate cyclase
VVSRSGGEVRKTVTVVFCDVSGSTSMGERLDPESLRRVMTRYFEEMRSVLEAHGGTVEKFIGDAVMAIFGVPAVHEDDALRAVRAATEMSERLEELNKELERDLGVTIQARIGVNTGEVMAGTGDAARGESLVTGDAVNVAARLEQAAEPGQVLIGDPTLRLVRDAVVVEPVGPVAAKGKADPVPAHALIEVLPGAEGVARHLEAPIVGRAQELGSLREALDRARREGTALLVTVIGPPGVGKSRLVEEFVSLHADDAFVAHGRCLSYGDGITYWPVVEILTAVSGIADLDGPEEIRGKIGGLLGGSPDATVVVERLAEFLGLSGATAAPEETHWAIRKLFESLATERPLVVVLEDLHWAEPALLDLVEHVVTWTVGAPILLLCTARPDLIEERPDWGTGLADAIRIPLEPLRQEDANRLVRNLIGTSALPAAAGPIVEAAEGNPLFLEQLVAMLIDEGQLRRDGDAWVAVDGLSVASIPSSISGILGARLERLAPEERAVLECGSVEGREFHWSSITTLSDGLEPAEVGRHLLTLARRGLIGPARSMFGGGEAFRFRHALIRDAAYARLPKAARADLHERHARWIERTAGDRVAEFEDVLAYHLEQASRLRSELGPLDEAGRRLAAEAARQLTSSAGRATGRGDARAANSLLDRALALMDPEDPARPDVSLRAGQALVEAGEPERAAAAFEDARTLAARLGDQRVEIRARLHAAEVKSLLEPEGTTEELERLIADAIPTLGELGDEEGLALAWKAAGVVALTRSNGAQMTTAFERASLHAERARDPGLLTETLSWLLSAAVVGTVRPEDANDRIRRVLQRAPEDRKLEALGAVHESMSLAELGRFDEARESYRRGQGILMDLGATMWAAGTRFSSGWVEYLADDPAAAEREYREGIEALTAMGEHAYLSTQAAYLAQVLYGEGRFDEAAEMADLAERSGSSDDLSTQVTARGVKAKLLARSGDAAGAIIVAEGAIDMLRESDFADLHGGALVDLAEVYQRAGRTEDAAAALRQAIEYYERRGLQPLVERTTTKLQQLSPSTG